MRSVVIEEPRRTAVHEVAVPRPARGQLRVKVQGCGVCGSNLPVWEGKPWFSYPFAPGAPGHEGWGTVDAIGEGVEGFEHGMNVAFLSYNAFAEYDVVDSRAAIRLPAWLNGSPFPGEPLGCAMNVFERSAIESGQTVAVVGIGFLGALLVRLARWKGARVVAVSRRAYALEIARQMGAGEAFAMTRTDDTVAHVKELTDGKGCECVIEATGKQQALDLAGDLVGERGRLVVAGYHQEGLRRVNMQKWNWQGIDVINAHERAPERYMRGMRAAVAAMEQGALDPTPLYTHRFTLDILDEAFEHMSTRPHGFMKGLLAL
ncbi:MAG: zinc-binding dehydrogenase [Chitinivibrionales bacterium]|nr:zinc-binding dehydrogenase [Chitinivibrionales bacterium]